MKKNLLICLSCCLMIPLFSNAKNLQAHFAFSTFFAPGNGPYVETYLNVTGASANYAKTSTGQFQASIEVSIIYKQLETVKYFDKYNLLSPEIPDTLKSLFNFTDLKRVSLPDGAYTMVLTIKDKNNPGAKPYELKQDITLSYLTNVIAISDIELLNDFKASASESPVVKNGYELDPLVANFYDKNNNELKLYAEIYNTSSILGKDPYLLNYHIETFETKKIIESQSISSRKNSEPVSILLTQLDISTLPSGNYNVVVEVRNRNNELLAVKQTFFQRSAPVEEIASANGDFTSRNIANTFASQITNKDTLAEYIRCLWPISSPNENTFAMNQLELADLTIMQQFFYDFWIKRDAQNPSKAWIDYKIQVDLADQFYHAVNKKGYMTDRGRVYLQYGPPNHIAQQYNEPNSFPYEIWQYYKAKKESNRKFVFGLFSLADSDFRLIHSDASGELYDRQWELLLQKRLNSVTNIDQNKPKNDYFGNQSDQLFTSPH